MAIVHMKRNGVLSRHGVHLPYNTQSVYSWVKTHDGCVVFFPIMDRPGDPTNETHINAQKNAMYKFIGMQTEWLKMGPLHDDGDY